MGDLFENCAASTSDTNPKQYSSCSTSSEISNNEEEPEDPFDYNNDNGGFVDKNLTAFRVSNCQEDSDIQLEDSSIDNNSNKPFDLCIDSSFHIIPQEGETVIPTGTSTKKQGVCNSTLLHDMELLRSVLNLYVVKKINSFPVFLMSGHLGAG